MKREREKEDKGGRKKQREIIRISDNIPDDEIMLDVLNTIFRRCLAKAVDLADLLRLPPPLRFPTVTAENPSAKS